jgi:hypothetical protein
LEGEILLARGQLGPGVQRLESAANLQPPMSEREYLAHAYRVARRPGEAIAAYRRLAVNPGYLWRQPYLLLPGIWAHCLTAALELCAETGTTDHPDLDSRKAFLGHQHELPPPAV